MFITEFNPANQNRIREFSLVKSKNQHSYCIFVMQNSSDKIDSAHRDFEKLIRCYDVEGDIKGQPSSADLLMSGNIDSVKLLHGYQENILTATLKSQSYKLDCEKKTRVYQDTTKTLGKIFEVLSKENSCTFEFQDNAISSQKLENPIVQMCETDFDFAVRMAKLFECSVWVNDKSDKSKFVVGAFREEAKKEFQKNNFVTLEERHKESEDFLNVTLKPDKENYHSIDIGSKIRFDGREYVVEKMVVEMRQCAYSYVLDLVRTKKQDRQQPIVSNTVTYHLLGKVADNKDPENKGRIQVDFGNKEKGIEDVVEGNNRMWISVATPYAAKNAGFLFIPDKDDVVDVLWDGTEFLVTNVRRTEPIKQELQEIDNKYICDLWGHCIKFTKDDFEIYFKENKIFFDDKINVATKNSQASLLDNLEVKTKEIVFNGDFKVEGKDIVLKGKNGIELN